MPENDPRLPKVLQEFGVAAWKLPEAAIRQMHAHSHPEAQLCGLDSGLAVLETDAGSWLCPPGRCMWIPSGMVHSLRSCGKISGWMLYMDAGRTEGMPSEPRVLSLNPLLKTIVDRIAGWVDSSGVEAARARLLEVLKDEIVGSSQIALHLPMPKEPALKRLAVRMAEHADEAAAFAALAHEFGLSERSLFRKFQQETGLSPGQWRREMQILRSMELLAEGRSVTEISLEVGYESTGAFTRAFRQVVGLTPSAYVRRQRLPVEDATHRYSRDHR